MFPRRDSAPFIFNSFFGRRVLYTYKVFFLNKIRKKTGVYLEDFEESIRFPGRLAKTEERGNKTKRAVDLADLGHQSRKVRYVICIT